MSKFVVLGKLPSQKILPGVKVVIANEDWPRKMVTVATVLEDIDDNNISYTSTEGGIKSAAKTDLYKLYLVDNKWVIDAKVTSVLVGDGTYYSYRSVDISNIIAKMSVDAINKDVLVCVGDISPDQYESIIKYNIDSLINPIDDRFIGMVNLYDTKPAGFGEYYPTANSSSINYYMLKEELFILRDICLNSPHTSPQFGEYILTKLMDNGYKLIKK